MQSLLFKSKKRLHVSNCIRQPCAGTTQNLLSAEDKNLTRLLREIRTFGRAVEGSSVSLLTNAVGGLSGGRRGGDTSAITAPSSAGARPRVGPLALVLATGTCCPPFFMRRAYANDVPAHPGARDQPCVDCACSTRRAKRSISLASASGALPLLVRGGLLARGSYFLIPFCNSSAASSAGSRTRVTGSRQNTMRVHPSLPSIFTARLPAAMSHVRRQLHWRALHHMPSQ